MYDERHELQLAVSQRGVGQPDVCHASGADNTLQPAYYASISGTAADYDTTKYVALHLRLLQERVCVSR
jgi:hypothetical protein